MTTSTAGAAAFDAEVVRRDFPVLGQVLGGDRRLVYLDSASTSQKPQQVIDALVRHYSTINANVGRGSHQLGQQSTEAYEDARARVARFIGAGSPDDVVFTRNATEGLNLVARSLGDAGGALGVGAGDRVVVTEMEHHSNLVPWQQLCARSGAELAWLGLTDDFRLDLRDLASVIDARTKVVAITWVSNVLGTVNDLAPVIDRAQEVGAVVVVDASQAAPHFAIDVSALGADVVALTGHKMLGPSGIGAVWARRDLWEQLPPFLGGGSMVGTVTMERFTTADVPAKFEAGTPPIAEAVGLGAACDYLSRLGMVEVARHEQELTAYALERLNALEDVDVFGPSDTVARGGAVAFSVRDIHPHDVSQVLDSRGVAVRAGHHCAKPLHRRYGVQSSTRASLYLYNTRDDVDTLIDAVQATVRFFRGSR